MATTIGTAKWVNVAVCDGADPELRQAVLEKLQAAHPNVLKWYAGDVSPALGVHTGPGLIGVGIQILD